ncbi:TniB family NTP-binding protein [Cupriavidus consociatus]|uniref:TniB family NTP-binding protein n=1 Tax=Cupriavidus consociatus TaxID=2821357 RepID=UPI001AE1B48B|nr:MULTISPECIES: TniB family NTP-binding protein [unclassified Cupriavidus]MBP0622930.1 TniB family NTP-binding protein [Cupriavidus sp. LEh25]MDK2659618.1 TniB family NTP-binding protein [Cupriavidus sp. LEh21]
MPTQAHFSLPKSLSQAEGDASSIVYGQIKAITIRHPDYVLAMEGIRECIRDSAYSEESRGCMVVGEGGMGKTRLAKQLIKDLDDTPTRIKRRCEIKLRHAFYVSIDGKLSAEALEESMLRELHDANPAGGSPQSKMARILEQFDQCETYVALIDEVHQMAHKKRLSAPIEGVLKKITESKTVVCLMAAEGGLELFRNDPQMARRFPKFTLHPFTPGIPKDPGLLQGFLLGMRNEIIKRTPIRDMPDFEVYTNVLRMYVGAGGNIAFTTTLLADAAKRAVREGRECFTLQDLAAVWSVDNFDSVRLRSCSENPFTADERTLGRAIRRL